MLLALIPLFVRMGFIHPVLLYGTNNVQTDGLSMADINRRSVGARLVLGGRIFYAVFIWTCKLTISEFLKRCTTRMWRRSYELTLRGIRVFLGITLVVVIIATLTECQPFNHYWQVVPNPGPMCRQGYGNLLAMGVADMITDILLIAFPIPIIFNSGQTWRRKLQLSSLFSLSIIPIIITANRIPKVIEARGLQQYRTVWASVEILAAAAISNFIIIGSMLRDKGTKRNRYRANSVSDSIERSSARRPTVTALENTGSDEDLFRFLGIRVPEHLQDKSEDGPRLAPAAAPATSAKPSQRLSSRSPTRPKRELGESHSSDSEDSLKKPSVPDSIAPSPPPSSRRAASFFDVGGLLEDGVSAHEARWRRTSPVGVDHESTTTQDFAPPTPSQSRRGSQAFLQDGGGLGMGTTAPSRPVNSFDRSAVRRLPDTHFAPPSRSARIAPTGVLGPRLERHETQQSLQDAGGLLAGIPESRTWQRAVPDSRRLVHRDSPDMFDDEDSNAQELDFLDIGGILRESHEMDASAAALRRATQRRSSPQARAGAEASSSGSSWQDMDIQDPGGLLTK